eukprot:NODE_1934_length_1246_cov_63.986633_g1603_i0.p1 GENE.NODE_1934_length_1246_cov_63.986633_g1603_i0~~NODE_1934_length_1246_cov_63.986633_g1603_i0.p1  ORF type:complete len:312 (+),score=67.94 NODE_1934_length_1246_cov_63.986633_g1603_i0:201-1136(+)
MVHGAGHVESGKDQLRSIRDGAVLQCLEAATLGMPFEVWKTRCGSFRHEGTFTALKNIHASGGGGIRGIFKFWSGTSAKMVESASKGAVLLWSKELILSSLLSFDMNPVAAGLLAGAGGGICQTVVMAPCTYLITCVVSQTTEPKRGIMEFARQSWKREGIRGFYHGASPIAARQCTNWASRQGLTELFRVLLQKRRAPDGNYKNVRLTTGEEVIAGFFGGALSCWNQPFEVCRIEAQRKAATGGGGSSLTATLAMLWREHGLAGWFKGVIPRIGLSVWQTIFMVSLAKVLKDHWAAHDRAKKEKAAARTH